MPVKHYPLLSKPVVRDQNGNAMSGITITWSITTGSGTLSATSTVSDSNGEASVTFTASSSAGNVFVRASAGVQNVSFFAEIYTYGQQLTGFTLSRPPTTDLPSHRAFNNRTLGQSNGRFYYVASGNDRRVFKYTITGRIWAIQMLISAHASY